MLRHEKKWSAVLMPMRSPVLQTYFCYFRQLYNTGAQERTRTSTVLPAST